VLQVIVLYDYASVTVGIDSWPFISTVADQQ